MAGIATSKVLETVAGGPAADVPAGSLNGLSILVVDDDCRWLLVALLNGHGAVVTTASSAEEAFSAISPSAPDVLVSDIGMPGETGYDLVRRVRALPTRAARTPAVAVTAYTAAEDRAKGLLLGFDHYVTKPVEPSELLAVLISVARRLPD